VPSAGLPRVLEDAGCGGLGPDLNMKKLSLEFVVGLFLVIGAICLAYLSIGIARREFSPGGGYLVQALFSNGTGLRSGSPVMIAGVEVGRVKRVALQDYEAKVVMVIQPAVVLQKDVIASIKTKGLIGEKYIEITPGAADEKIPPGGMIHGTQPAMDLEGLISKFVQGNLTKPTN
jgi:phospholipid/cholesterol/gamma-HCH transport system substrate-binding protein